MEADEVMFEVYLIRSDLDILSYYKSQVVDNVLLYAIKSGSDDILLTLYSGGNSTQLTDQAPYSTVYPDSDGYFEFINIEPGQYILSVNDTDQTYSPFVEQDLYIMGDADSMNQDYRTILLNDQSYTDYKLRVVLTWTGQESETNKDLDLYAQFQLSERYICSVGFYLPLC
jgi:hypothetical protein